MAGIGDDLRDNDYSDVDKFLAEMSAEQIAALRTNLEKNTTRGDTWEGRNMPRRVLSYLRRKEALEKWLKETDQE